MRVQEAREASEKAARTKLNRVAGQAKAKQTRASRQQSPATTRAIEHAKAAGPTLREQADKARAAKGTREERVAKLTEKLNKQLPQKHDIMGRYPKIGQHDREVASNANAETGRERVVRNRTGTKTVYIESKYGFMSKSGVTASPKKSAQWTNAVLRKAKLQKSLSKV